MKRIPSARLSVTLRLALTACAAIAAAAAILAASAVPAPAAVRLIHESPRNLEAGISVVIDVGIAGEFPPERLVTADLVVATSDGWVQLPMSMARNVLSGQIPGRLVTPPALRYYVRLVDSEGVAVALPTGAPDAGAFTVPVFELSGTSVSGYADTEVSPGVEILSPLPAEIVSDPTPSIAVLVEPPMGRPLEPTALLDGIDVTDLLEVDEDYLVLVPSDSLSRGAHRITLVALTPGRRVEASWPFYVLSAQAEGAEQPVTTGVETMDPYGPTPFELHGRAEIGWVTVIAETTAADTTSAFLPFKEVDRPTLDLYASAMSGETHLMLSAQYDPVYDENASWSASAETRRLMLQAGDVYPNLSGTTLDWAVGRGGIAEWRQGCSRTELIAMRMSEADTVGGFGVYSRFALAGREAVEWGDGSSASVIYMYAFDREASVPDTQRIAE
ncbi:MAG: hypothetical protein JXB46_01775, partial [Candidatus Eisenbacteria bacterium]|nr:hypothetical protein [Candidatus Eisenbacteria bacterium]